MDKLESNIYTTPEKKYSSFLPSIRFYLRLFSIVIKANRLARRNQFDGKAYLKANWDILNALEKSGVKVYAEGIDHIRNLKGPAIFIGNHMSSLETMTLASFIEPFGSVLYIQKKELLDYPLFGIVTGARDPIAVGRANPREDLIQVLNEGKEKLKQGRSIIIFPQRTRTKYFEPQKFNTLGIKLAQRSNVDVIPVALLTDAWGAGKFIKDFGKIAPSKQVKISFGEPFKVTTSAEAHQKVLDFIASKLKEWGREDLIVSHQLDEQ